MNVANSAWDGCSPQALGSGGSTMFRVELLLERNPRDSHVREEVLIPL